MSSVLRFAAGAIVCLAILVAVFALLAGLTSVRVSVEPGASAGVSWFVIPVVALPLILLFLFVWSIRVLMRDDRKGPGSPQEEAELIQELHRTAERLEERLNALETILLEEREPQRARW
ncbi:MAG: envelope stress response membrane protein PspB [Candidatus Hydrogenedentota bacterium]